MIRRQYLALSAATLSTTVAGCSFLGDGTGDGNGDGTPTETPSPPESRLADFRSALESADFVLGEVELDDGILMVEYESAAETEAAVLEESEPVVRAFLAALDGGMDAEWLEAWLIDGEGQARAVYTVHESWARDWDEGAKSDEEFFGRIRESLSWQ